MRFTVPAFSNVRTLDPGIAAATSPLRVSRLNAVTWATSTRREILGRRSLAPTLGRWIPVSRRRPRRGGYRALERRTNSNHAGREIPRRRSLASPSCSFSNQAPSNQAPEQREGWSFARYAASVRTRVKRDIGVQRPNAGARWRRRLVLFLIRRPNNVRAGVSR